jgi:hypothetical protein
MQPRRKLRSADRMEAALRRAASRTCRPSAAPYGGEHISAAIQRRHPAARVPVAPDGNRPAALIPTEVNNIGSAPVAVDCFRHYGPIEGRRPNAYSCPMRPSAHSVSAVSGVGRSRVIRGLCGPGTRTIPSRHCRTFCGDTADEDSPADNILPDAARRYPMPVLLARNREKKYI